LAKRLSNTQKEEIIKRFSSGEDILDLSLEFGYTKLTVTRNLKKALGDELFNKLILKTQSLNKSRIKSKEIENISPDSFDLISKVESSQSSVEDPLFSESTFVEIPPYECEFNDESRKEVSSIPLEEIDLPKVVYMIVDKKTELIIKLLKDYPEWQFLPDRFLECKTIEIYSDLKIAKRDCNKDQKVIKVPNTNVFRIASKIMRSKGITRIINENKLIAI
jgi:hypothetical protein